MLSPIAFCAITIALSVWFATESRADIVTFVFTDTAGGSISGQINDLFAVPGNQVATAIWINSVVKIGTQFPVSHTLPYSSGAGGSFQVVGGVVTQAHFTTGFRGGNPATVFTFDFGTPGPTFNHQSFNNGARQTGTNMVVGNINTVPEPSAFSLFAISLIGLGCVARRKRKNRA